MLRGYRLLVTWPTSSGFQHRQERADGLHNGQEVDLELLLTVLPRLPLDLPADAVCCCIHHRPQSCKEKARSLFHWQFHWIFKWANVWSQVPTSKERSLDRTFTRRTHLVMEIWTSGGFRVKMKAQHCRKLERSTGHRPTWNDTKTDNSFSREIESRQLSHLFENNFF